MVLYFQTCIWYDNLSPRSTGAKSDMRSSQTTNNDPDKRRLTVIEMTSLHKTLGVRATALAAADMLMRCKKANPNRPENLSACALNILYMVLRGAACGMLPIPRGFSRSAVTDSEARFNNSLEKNLQNLIWRKNNKIRPPKNDIVDKAMRMLPSARGGQGPQIAEGFLRSVPSHLFWIRSLLSHGIELLCAQDIWRKLNPSRKRPAKLSKSAKRVLARSLCRKKV